MGRDPTIEGRRMGLTPLELWKAGFGGPPARGPWHHKAKLRPSDVREIRELHKRGWGYKRLAAKFGVCHMTIKALVIGKTWKTVVQKPTSSQRLLEEQEAEYQEARAARRAHIMKCHQDLEQALDNLRER